MMDSLTQRLLMGVMGGAGIPVVESYATQRNSSSSANLIIPKPAGVAEGDLLVAIMATSSGGARTWTPPAGWDERLDQGASPDLGISTRTADGLEGSSFTFTASNSIQNLAGSILRISGAAFDTIGSAGTLSGAGTITAPSITSAGGLLIFAAGWSSGGDMSPTPTGMDEILAYAGLPYPHMNICGAVVAAGATGDRSGTFAANPGNVAAALISIKGA